MGSDSRCRAIRVPSGALVVAKKKVKRLAPLKPHIKGGVVIMKIPAGTPPDEMRKALEWQRNVTKKINLMHEKDHYYEQGDWRSVASTANA